MKANEAAAIIVTDLVLVVSFIILFSNLRTAAGDFRLLPLTAH